MSDEYKRWVEQMAEGTAAVEVFKTGDEMPDVIVCRLAPQGAPLLVPDNLVGHCSKCWRMVQFRPHAPKVRRVCDQCLRLELAEQKAGGFKFLITENTLSDLATYAKKRRRQ